MRLIIGLALLALTASAAQAHEVKAGDLTLSNLQVRASLGSNPNTAAYLTIANAGAKPDRLLSASCACAAKVEAHQTMMHGGMSMMMAAPAVAIPARGSVSFTPGGLHLMVTGLKAPLKDGGMQEFTLRFERAGAVKAGFHVTSRIAAEAVHAH
ncbi:MAG: copper chaperone PCu(A)C [Caulobacteraceae bacterium]